MQLCDTLHLPLVSLAESPGFMAGPNPTQESSAPGGASSPRATTAACRGLPSSSASRTASPGSASTAPPACPAATPRHRPTGDHEHHLASPPPIAARSRPGSRRGLAVPHRRSHRPGHPLPARDPRPPGGVRSHAQRAVATQLGPPPFPYMPQNGQRAAGQAPAQGVRRRRRRQLGADQLPLAWEASSISPFRRVETPAARTASSGLGPPCSRPYLETSARSCGIFNGTCPRGASWAFLKTG